MIAYLKGTIKNKGQGYFIVEVAGVGYRVHINSTLYVEKGVGDEVELYVHHYIREGIFDLYGFKNMNELEMFELLLSISGVGPKSALGVIAIAPVGDIKSSIASGDASLLVKVSGIGKKTAERVVLELREKVGKVSGASASGLEASGDEIDALEALGYSLAQAREALKKVDSSIKDSGERIREALKNI